MLLVFFKILHITYSVFCEIMDAGRWYDVQRMALYGKGFSKGLITDGRVVCCWVQDSRSFENEVG